MSDEKAALEALRQLLLNPDRDRMSELEADLKEPERLAVHLKDALPPAIKQSTGQDSRLSRAMTPLLEEAIQASIRRNPRLMSEILFPIIGRAVRKAVWEAWSNLIQSVNGVLETRVSLKSLRWRWIAWRTGRTFAEIVLAQTFVYRVEQVFLIHRETGLLLAHEMREAGVAKDKELVSAMLTAIQDFVRDSFEVEEETPLGALELGGLKVWVEQGPHAYLAGVIRGNPPEDLRGVLRDTLEQVHFEFSTEMQEYDGEDDRMAASDQILLGAMRYERQEAESGGVPWYALLVAAVLLVSAGWYTYQTHEAGRRLEAVRAALDGTPGYRVLAVSSSRDVLHIEGFKDPLALPVHEVLAQFADPNQLDADLTPYIALQPQLILARAGLLLSPPATVRLNLDENSRLIAVGNAEVAWLRRFETTAPLVPGVLSIDFGAVTVLKTRMEVLTKELESWQLLFEVDQDTLSTEHLAEVESVSKKVTELHGLAEEQDKVLRVAILGFTDASGSATHNRALALRRARAVRDAFVALGIPQQTLKVQGFTNQSEGRANARRIILAIHFENP